MKSTSSLLKRIVALYPKNLVVFEGFRVVFELFEILELFEYLVAKYSIFEVKLFVLESETLVGVK